MPLRSRHMPSINALIIFDMAARKLSFTEAGGELGITQAAVSRQINALEQHFGCALFRRLHRQVALTDKGIWLAASLAPAFDQIEDSVWTMLVDTRPVELVIAATGAFSHFWLMPRISSFRMHHPGIVLRIVNYELLPDLDRAGLDIAIHYGDLRHAGDHLIHLLDEEIVAVCSPEYARKRSLPIAMEELGRHDLIALDSREKNWTSWDDWMSAFGARRETRLLSTRCSSYVDAISLALSGHGLVIGWVRLIDDLLKAGSLIKACSETLRAESGYRLIVPRKQSSPEVNAFVAWIRQEAAAALGATTSIPELSVSECPQAGNIERNCNFQNFPVDVRGIASSSS